MDNYRHENLTYRARSPLLQREIFDDIGDTGDAPHPLIKRKTCELCMYRRTVILEILDTWLHAKKRRLDWHAASLRCMLHNVTNTVCLSLHAPQDGGRKGGVP